MASPGAGWWHTPEGPSVVGTVVTQGGHSALAECSVSRTEIHLSKSSVGLATLLALQGSFIAGAVGASSLPTQRSAGSVTGMASSGDLAHGHSGAGVGDLRGGVVLGGVRSSLQAGRFRGSSSPAWVGRSGNSVVAAWLGSLQGAWRPGPVAFPNRFA